MVLESNSIAGIDRALRTDHNVTFYLRIVLALLLGGCAALFMAWFMHYLIKTSDVMLQNANNINMLDFVRIKREESVQRKDRNMERPQLNKAPDVPPLPQSSAEGGERLTVSAMPTTTDVAITQGGVGFGTGEGDYLPIVKVAPIFPQRALARGIFGECLVRYTVTTNGSVKDVEVIKERCSSPLFFRPSADAALRFKYKPRVIDGEPVEVRGVLNMFYYREVFEDR